MLARFIKPNATFVAKRVLLQNAIRATESHRYGSSSVQHGSHGAADHHDHGHHHHDPYQTLYERLWQHKATLDWLPKPEGSWQEANAQQQAHYNKILIAGVVSIIASYVYLRAVIIKQSGATLKAPYHLIGNEDFPGSKYEDATGVPSK